MFNLYIRWISTFNNDIEGVDEVSICTLIRGTIYAFVLTFFLIGGLCLVSFIYLYPILYWVGFIHPRQDNGEMILVWFTIILLWIPTIYFITAVFNPNLIRKITVKFEKPTQGKLSKLVSDMGYAIKTKTCFKVKIRG